MIHYVRTKNLPYSISEIRQMTAECGACQEVKPNFARSNEAQLIKATQVFERLNLDFKGPLPTVSKNKYILTIVDEYSRFPFAFPCADMTAKTVIQCLATVFSVFGMCSYIHSDRWSAFQSHELKTWLQTHGVASSRTTSYNPRGNGQCEKYNGVIWKAIQCALKSRNLLLTHWEGTLTDALHSIRSLLCTSTNCTPHERMFRHARRSVTGTSIPTWLKPGPIFVKRHVRNKDEPLVDEAELLEVNPNYAHVRLRDGTETTVSIRDLSPCSKSGVEVNHDYHEVFIPSEEDKNEAQGVAPSSNDGIWNSVNDCGREEVNKTENQAADTPIAPPRRSTRVRKPVEKYDANQFQ